MHLTAPCRRRLHAVLVAALLTLLASTPAVAGVSTLLDAFNAASPGSGYDTLVTLDRDTIYTGGLTLPAGNHCIIGNGALVNLQASSVQVGDGVSLDVSGVSFTNGTYGLDISGTGVGHVECCNFINNNDGLRAWDTASVTLLSCNFVDNDHYGVYRYEYALVHNAYNNAWGNTANDYVYYCPG
jgi:hypothetical protein